VLEVREKYNRIGVTLTPIRILEKFFASVKISDQLDPKFFPLKNLGLSPIFLFSQTSF
jgi:hypothetical protein